MVLLHGMNCYWNITVIVIMILYLCSFDVVYVTITFVRFVVKWLEICHIGMAIRSFYITVIVNVRIIIIANYFCYVYTWHMYS